MTRVILWKEVCEQWTVWVALALLAALALFGVPALFARSSLHNLHFVIVAAALAWLQAAVCGAALLAGETEAGTQTFLDTLPGGRRAVFAAKLAAGAVMSTVFTLLVGVALAVQMDGEPHHVAAGLAVVVAAAVLGLGYGLVGSAYAKSALAAVGTGGALLAGAAVVGGFFALFVVSAYYVSAGRPFEPAAAVVLATAAVAALPWYYARSRYVGDEVAPAAVRRLPSLRTPGAGRAVRELAWRQGRAFLLGSFVVAVPCGLTVAAQPIVLWPAVSLLFAAVTGAVTFIDEQHGPRQFLGDQRFPPGPIWWNKVAMSASTLIVSLAVLALPSVVAGRMWDVGNRTDVRIITPPDTAFFRDPIFTWISSGYALWLVPPVSGFACGVFFGLLFRNPLVAGFAAIMVAVMHVCVWLPSIALGGVQIWQVTLAPAVMFTGSRLLMRPWLADALGTPREMMRASGIGLVAIVAIAAGLAYRVLEYPELPEPAGLGQLAVAPTADDEAGALLREGLRRAARDMPGQVREPAAAPDGMPPAAPPMAGRPMGMQVPAEGLDDDFVRSMLQVVNEGWPKTEGRDSPHAVALRKFIASEGVAQIRKAAAMPTGVFASNNMPGGPDSSTPIQVAAALAAHGLMRQRLDGDDLSFVKDVSAALVYDAARCNRTSAGHLGDGQSERWVLGATRVWLANLGNAKEPMRQMLALLDRHLAAVDVDLSAALLRSYAQAKDRASRPGEVVGELMRRWTPHGTDADHLVAIEAAAQVPHEKERLSRVLRYTHTVPKARYAVYDHFLRFVGPASLNVADIERRLKQRLAALEATRLTVAARLHQARTGKLPAVLADMVPSEIAEIPRDPFGTGESFTWRVSQGEEIGHDEQNAGGVVEEMTEPMGPVRRHVPKGLGVIGYRDGGRGRQILVVPPPK